MASPKGTCQVESRTVGGMLLEDAFKSATRSVPTLGELTEGQATVQTPLLFQNLCFRARTSLDLASRVYPESWMAFLDVAFGTFGPKGL